MKQSNSLSKRVLILLAVFCAFRCVASADTVYDVSGSFTASGTSNPFTGPLNGGTFSGTFSTTLPTTSNETITSFNINLIDSSGKTIVTISNSVSGDVASIQVLSANDCAVGPATAGPCDYFQFVNSSYTDGLALFTPLGFAGGPVYADVLVSGSSSSFAFVGDTGIGSLVASGSIEPATMATPEPASLLLLGTGLLGLAILARGQLERKRSLEH